MSTTLSVSSEVILAGFLFDLTIDKGSPVSQIVALPLKVSVAALVTRRRQMDMPMSVLLAWRQSPVSLPLAWKYQLRADVHVCRGGNIYMCVLG